MTDWIHFIESLRARFIGRVLGLGRYTKRTLLVINDLVVLSFAIWVAFTVRYGEFFVPPDWKIALLMGLAPVLSVLVFAQIGLYRKVTRYIGSDAVNSIGAALAFSILVWVLGIFLSGWPGTPRMALLFYWTFGTLGVWGSRQLAAWIFNISLMAPVTEPLRQKTPVLIYGAGPAGVQLSKALTQGQTFEVVGFIDQSPTLWGQYVDGHKVYRPARMPEIVEREGVKEILLAISDRRRQDRVALIREVEKLHVKVRLLPQIEDIATGRVTVNDLRPVGAEDLLGREPVQPNPDLLSKTVAGKTVMVTGAGGSIGSELVRQIVRHKARCIVLFDLSENALYEIDREVRAIIGSLRASGEAAPKIIHVLGSVLDGGLVRNVIRDHGVETIYHAAAYKHVPIVQKNIGVGFANNTLGTIVLAEAAEELGVERFVLISTDKAVRPSSLMGASKRLAEMALQARAAVDGQRTIFTIVRFGNVLDSSGSVVRLFRDQIERGGPVTVTHKDMIRYFMSIPEAASLVMQAAAMGRGGEVFVLDMGEPVKIDDLARSMIRLMGREVRDASNPTGDIAIEYVGLRPGEKLYEELLIGANTSGTEHARIQRSEEPYLPQSEFDAALDRINAQLAARDVTALHDTLTQVVEGYHLGGHVEAVVPPRAIAAAGADAISSKTLH